MPDNSLQFETKVDLSGLNSGMDAAQSRVSAFGNNIKSAMAAAADATKSLADAQTQLGAAAEQGNASAAAVIQEYQAQVDAANAAVTRLSATEEKETQVLRSSISTRMAASAELRILEGNTQGSTRAVAALISQFPALAAAAQAAFTGFALVAVGEIAVDVGKKIYDAFDLGGERARALTQDLLDLDTEFRHENDSLDLQIAKLEAEQAKLEHRPQNGIALTLAEAANEADHLAERLKSLDDQESKSIEKMSGSFLQRALLGQSQTGYEGTMLQEHVKWIEKATTTQGQLNESLSFANSLQTRMNDLRSQQVSADKIAVDSGSGATSYANEIRAVQELMDKQKDEQSVIQKTIDLNKEQGVVNNEKGERVHTPKGPQINRIQLMIEELNQSTQINNAFHERIQAMWEQDNRAEMEAYRKGEQADNERTELFKKNQKEMYDAAQESLQSQHETTLGGINTQATKVQAGMSLGITDPAKDLAALTQLHAAAEAENEKFIQSEIANAERYNQSVVNLDKQLGIQIQKGQQQQITDAEKQLSQQVANFKKAYAAITQDFNTAINSMITKGESPAKAFAQMLNSMIGQLASFIEQYLEKKAEMWVLDQILTKTSQTSVAVGEITANAAVAGSAAFAATAGIPVVGPALAPAAGAAAFSGALSFLSLAAFEQGGVVAGGHGMPVPIMAHAGERVLSAPQTAKFDSMVNGGGNSSSTTTHLHYSPQVSAYDTSNMRSMLNLHASDIHDLVNRGIRDGNIRARG